MRALVLIHRWLGVAFCLLFAMWFASGMVMHFVPYPALEESERVAGLAAFNPQDITIAPRDALKALEVHKVRRMRLAAVGGTPAYIVSRNDGTLAALDANSGKAFLVNEAIALASARSHAQARGLDVKHANILSRESHDQWSVANGFDAHRPLYQVTLGDAADTVLYVSSVTGEVVLDTASTERAWNWVGSVLHWIYPTALRKHWPAWDSTVWWLSLAAMIGALTGTALGVLRLKALQSPFRGWMKWHHILGLSCALFVLTWIFSGWLSMDHGRLFSRGAIEMDDRMRIEGRALSVPDLPQFDRMATPLREIEWFPFGGQIVMRIIDHTGNREILADAQRSATLTDAQLTIAAHTLGGACSYQRVDAGDAYAARSAAVNAPVYRLICGETWFHIDGADGRVIEKLDASRRAYRWAFQALHTFDFPALNTHPALRTLIIVVLCAVGFAFSVTGVVIGWRRLKRTVH
jgi:PepSY-associated TM region